MLTSGQNSLKSDYAKAILQFENSRDLFAQLGDTAEAAIAENLAVQLLPDVARVAESRLRLATIITNAERRKFIVLVPPAYYWLGRGDFQLNQISEANKHFKIALRWAEAGKNAFEVQHSGEVLAESYSELGELGPALSYANKLLPDEGLYYQNPSQFFRNKGTLADLSLKLKFFSTCLSLSRERLTIAQENSPGSSHVNDSLRHMISAAAETKDFPTALKYANESKRIALSRPDSKENTRTTAEIYLLLADLENQTSDCNQALLDYDKALDLFGQLREFEDRLYQIHKGRLFCFEQLKLQADFVDELKTVVKLSEEYRMTIREDSSRQAFFANEQVVFDLATANAIKERDSLGAFTFVEESKARSLLDFVESGKSIAEAEKDFGPVAQPLSLAEIQARIPNQVQLLEYAMLPDRLEIWLVSGTRFDLAEKSITAAELEKKITTYQALIVGKAPAADIRQAGQELYELLIPPNLAPGKHLCLVPDKVLHQLAFATLVSRTGKYLLEDYALLYAPSASVLVLATENARQKEQAANESLLSIGNPDFDREDNPGLADLRAAEVEAKAIAGDYRNSQDLVGGAATKDKFLEKFANVEVIHFAGHFVANRLSPGNSKLLFAGGDLRSSELSAYKLPQAKLVVLSACETGFERYNKSEGSIGIARTLLAMGAPLVVASQWQVDSEPTKDLMIAFHRNRKQKGMNSADSLRLAQLELLRRDETKAPFYWAAFSLFGGYANY